MESAPGRRYHASMRAAYVLVATTVLLLSAMASGQQPQAPPPPAVPAPGQPHPPPGAWQPPPYPTVYAQPGSYAYAPRPYRPPPVLDYEQGDPIPPGYHVETFRKKGLLTAGWIVTAVSYGIGLMAASGAEFRNGSGWLAVPVVGPWLTMGQRDYGCGDAPEENENAGLECVGDIFVVMGLILDGAAQATGGSLLLAGSLSSRQKLVPDVAVTWIGPQRVGSGSGLGLTGRF